LAEYPADLLEDHRQLFALVEELAQRFGDQIVVHLVDPQSWRGVLKSLRYRVRKYPAFIVDDQELIVGWNKAALERAIEIRSAELQGR
jgi:imidazole glycerol phosphate synthase subunit HisF